ncbi:C6 zinc finger protein [Xylaria bambusicola]|uniref:C6 zinc finger protein n=1 Tax=Xylaria bambusicola TaxID=326684 RepID=UPI002008DC04|nr:C6 zinc finger protein [Xylaria bambusicola]KAI0513174.1 C6 zinc finger protein [Xylaria bambusicola]
MDPLDFSQSTSLPLLTLGSNNTEFDYAAYLQDDDLDYLGDTGSSGSASVMNDVTSAGVSPPTSSAVVRSNSNQKPRLERRGHTKSRRGCYNCKRRRIKCQETRPSCGHCVKTGLKCEYPVVPQITHQPQHQIPLFSLQDMRFFQHFLLTCSPHHPLGNESIWTHEVPCLSQNHEYLMHAILGLAASDLMIHDPSLVTFAMAHRLKAIKAIKKTLTDVPKTNTFEEGNALLATCYALTFQSVMLDDGMAEFMTFCRGIIIVAIQMYCKGAKFIFSNFLGDDQMEILQPLMEAIPPIRTEWTDMAVANIAALQPLCQQQVEIDYHQLLTEIAEALYTSSFEAYQKLCKHYGWWMQISHENFQSLIDGGNQVCLLLASHWIALKQIMATITGAEHYSQREKPGRKDGDMDLGMVRWLKHINRHIDADHQQYNQWPLWVEAQLDINLGYFGKELLRH